MVEDSRSNSDTSQSVGLIWTSDQPDEETHNTHKRQTIIPLVTERNKEILEELKVEPGDGNLPRYKSKLLRHMTRKNINRMPKIMLNARRRRGRPLKSP
jgi:hypothetical protein